MAEGDEKNRKIDRFVADLTPPLGVDLARLGDLLQVSLEAGEATYPPMDAWPQGDSIASDGSLRDYEMQEEIGRGGMGVIHRARHLKSGRQVALKLILPHYAGSAAIVERFRREVQTVASLTHPHIMPIYDMGERANETPFLVMPLAEAGSLLQAKEKYRGRWRQIARLVEKIARAVHCAHQQGIIHRDLKPGNILFTEQYEPLVSDFGLAKWLDGKDDLTKSLVLFGTPGYVAPEQLTGGSAKITTAVDVYSIGAIFYELLTNRPPFVGDNALAVVHQAAKLRPQRPRAMNRCIPKELEAVCLRCLEREPTDRYLSSEFLADDLDRWLNGVRITGGAQPWTRLWRWSYPRTRAVVTTLSLVLGMTAAGALIANKFGGGGTLPARASAPLLELESFENLNQQDSPALKSFAPLLAAHLVAALEKLGSPAVSSTEGTFTKQAHTPARFAATFRMVEGKTRLISRLVQPDDGALLWTHADEVPNSDPVKMAKVLGARVADALHGRWNPSTREFLSVVSATNKSNEEARNFYAKALELYNRRTKTDNENAIGLFQRAIALEPSFAAAHAGLAEAISSKFDAWGESEEWLKRAIISARQAVALDPGSAKAHKGLGRCHFYLGEYQPAMEEFWRALELEPGSPSCNAMLGMSLRELGHPEEAIKWMEKAERLDPVHGDFSGILAETLMLLPGEDARSEKSFKRAIELDPDQPQSCFSLGVLKLWQGRFVEAQQMLTTGNGRDPDNKNGLSLEAQIAFFAGDASEAQASYQLLLTRSNIQNELIFFGAVNPTSALGFLQLQAGKTEEGREKLRLALKADESLLDKPIVRSRALHDMAATHAALGEEEQALRCLAEAIAAGWRERRSTRLDPRFRSMLTNQRFQDMTAMALPAL